MAFKAINYDLKSGDVDDYEELYNAIKALGSYSRALESFWIINSSKTSIQIRNELKQHLKKGDKLMVSSFGKWAAWNMSGTSKWLNA